MVSACELVEGVGGAEWHELRLKSVLTLCVWVGGEQKGEGRRSRRAAAGPASEDPPLRAV